MAGGIKETDPEKLAKHCGHFMHAVKKLYDGDSEISGLNGEMWLFELYHHLQDCSEALRSHQQSRSDA